MSSLAFFASPIDFEKNEKLDNKIKKEKQNKLNMDMLKKFASGDSSASEDTVDDIKELHNNLDESLKHENENTLANFYSEELAQDIKKQVSETESSQDLYHNKAVLTDYLISNNLNTNSVNLVGATSLSGMESRDELLEKLNHIINLFEDEREIKTNKKQEEVVLYCFLGIFIIYVLDSFVSIGKYKR